MFVKILITVAVALTTMVIFRQMSERDKKSRVPVKDNKRRVQKVKNLVWDEKSQSYRADD